MKQRQLRFAFAQKQSVFYDIYDVLEDGDVSIGLVYVPTNGDQPYFQQGEGTGHLPLEALKQIVFFMTNPINSR